MSMVELPLEWAVGGKPPGSGDDYEILACSQKQLSRDDFEEIRTVYATGTPENLPQVTIAWVGADENTRLVLAIQDWSDEKDRRHRSIARTRYFCVPYARLARPPSPVSYEELHRALAVFPLPTERQVVVSVPTLDSGVVAARIGAMVTTTAALLMTGRHVCVVGGEAVSVTNRLRFLDTVAALLPYGMRARLTASTWASSTAEHKIRLSFTQHVPHGTYPVTWGQLAEIPGHEQDAHDYLDLLLRHSLDARLIGWLATRTEPLTFGKNGRARALDMLRRFDPSPPPALVPPQAITSGQASTVVSLPVDADQDPVERLLVECAETLAHGGEAELKDVLIKLDGVVAGRGMTISEDERVRYQKIIRNRQLLSGWSDLSEELEAQLFEVILMAGYGLTVTPEQMGGISRDVLHPTRALMTAIVRRPVPDPVVSMILAHQLGQGELEEALRPQRTRDLVEVAARQPYDMRVVTIACDELVRRGGADAEDPEVAKALCDHGYLTDAVGALYPATGRSQFDLFRDLLKASYGQELHIKAFEEILRSPGARSPMLVAAAVALYGTGAGGALKTTVIRFLGESGLDPEIFEHVRLLIESEPGVSHLTTGKPQGKRRRVFGGGPRRPPRSGDRPGHVVPIATLYSLIGVLIAVVVLLLVRP
ncbi:hypothetical protein [Streptosporangium sp. NPDC002524]|uniref:hypothetical protein n=1 Tax=Streptosporangium sp. NPDC002524 TaxID=3154537 RepID=UPI00332C60D3